MYEFKLKPKPLTETVPELISSILALVLFVGGIIGFIALIVMVIF